MASPTPTVNPPTSLDRGPDATSARPRWAPGVLIALVGAAVGAGASLLAGAVGAADKLVLALGGASGGVGLAVALLGVGSLRAAGAARERRPVGAGGSGALPGVSLHTALAEVGQLALGAGEPAALDARVASLTAQTLGVPVCQVLRIDEQPGLLRLSAAVGVDAALVGHATVRIDGRTQQGLTALTGTAAVCDGPEQEPASPIGPAFRAAMSVPMAVGGARYGVLSAQSKEGRTFSAAELQFAQSMANLLALATQRQMAQSELARREAEYRKLSLVASHTDNAVVITDPSGALEWCNDAFERLTERTLEEMQGRRLGDLLQGAGTDPATARELRERVRAGESFRVEILNYSRSGRPYWVMIDAKPIHNELGVVVRFIAIEREITDRKAVETQLRARSAELRAMQDASPTGIFGCDASGSVVAVNRTFEVITGLAPSQALGDGWLRIVHEADRATVTAQWTRARELAVAAGLTTRLTRRDGTGVWAAIKTAPVLEEGRVTGFVGTLEDITARVLAEQAAATAAERYRAAAQGSLDAFMLLEPAPIAMGEEADFVVVDVNDRGARSAGLAREAIIGRRLSETFPTSRGSGLLAMCVEVARGRGVLEREVVDEPTGQVGGGGGRGRRWTRHQVVPLAAGVAVTSRDITAQRDADESLRALNAKLEEKNAELEQFVYTVSHDLKSPLVTIGGFLGHLRRDLDSGDGARLQSHAQRIDTAVTRMRETIDDLLELSRIGRDPGHSRVVDVRLLATELAQEYADRLAASRARLVIQPGLPLLVIDDRRLRELLDNLLSNALKYACNTPGRMIDIGCVRPPVNDAGQGEVRLFVRDDGPGIDPAYHERIFGLFQRLDNSREGTGVGLAIVRRLMGLYGGRAWVESSPGEGATFYLAFPAGMLAEEPLAPMPEPKHPLPAATADTGTAAAHRASVAREQAP